MHSLTFNSIKKEWLILKQGRSKAPFAPINRTLISAPGMDGAFLSSTNLEPMIINQPVAFFVDDNVHALQLKDELASWLFTKEPVPLQFPDEPGRTYFAVVQNTIEDFEKFIDLRQGTIQFLLPDPYGYSDEKPFIFPSDAVNLTNSGTADADPIFELEVLKPVTFAMVQNHNEEYMMIGRPLSVSEEVVNTRKLLFNEVGDTLDTWTTTPTAVDGGVVSGTMNSDGAGITVPNYGTGDKWHGPALLKEVSPAQDFEVDVHLQIRTTDVSQTARVEVYLYDEGMKVLGKMAIMDNQLRLYQKNGEARFGPFINIHENYLISSKNYQYAWDYWFGMLRFRRVGNEFEFYITRIGTNNKHVYSLKKTFRDTGNEFDGKLKYVQIHIGTHGSTSRAYSAKMFSVSAYELTKATEDQTPYIAYENDIITFDHVNDEIMINGEDRKDLKDFGASYFQLSKGDNALVVHPDDSFETRVKYRNRYR